MYCNYLQFFVFLFYFFNNYAHPVKFLYQLYILQSDNQKQTQIKSQTGNIIQWQEQKEIFYLKQIELEKFSLLKMKMNHQNKFFTEANQFYYDFIDRNLYYQILKKIVTNYIANAISSSVIQTIYSYIIKLLVSFQFQKFGQIHIQMVLERKSISQIQKNEEEIMKKFYQLFKIKSFI
ncbi:hypothetical protein pb186bvf_017094 [Paramecium bursaria]